MSDLDRAVSQAKAWRFLSFLGGQSPYTSTFDFKTLVHTLMGAGNSIQAEDLMQCEVGLAAESLSQIANPIWLVRAADDAMLRRWFPQHAQSETAADTARIFRTDDGRFVCIRGRVVAMAPRASDWTQLGSILRAMAGADADILEKLPAYRESIAYLPARSLVTIYVAESASIAKKDKLKAGFLTLGVYSKGQTIDVAFRGSWLQPVGKGSIATAAMERMLKLPLTTLGAYITTIDWTALTSQRHEAPPGTLPRYARLIADLSRADTGTEGTIPRLGRHLILAWGQDLSVNGSIPQLAVLVESPDALLMTLAARRVSITLGRILSTLELRDVTDELRVRDSVHLGVAVSSISLRTFAEKSRFPLIRALGVFEPSWASSGDWFIVTLTPDHLNQILDAQIGFLGNLADQRDAQSLRDPSQQSVSVAFLQGALASSTMKRWERNLRDANAEGMFRQLWQSGMPADENGDRLGIELSDNDEFSLLKVIAVTPGTPADGRLYPGDRILGVDGRLLEMVAPADDLREWWEEATPGSSHTMRVLRDESVMELEVTRRHDEVSISDLFAQPLDVLHELALLCDTIPVATLQIHHTGDEHLSAFLSLRLDSRE